MSGDKFNRDGIDASCSHKAVNKTKHRGQRFGIGLVPWWTARTRVGAMKRTRAPLEVGSME